MTLEATWSLVLQEIKNPSVTPFGRDISPKGAIILLNYFNVVLERLYMFTIR
jgi:hypothetical protein